MLYDRHKVAAIYSTTCLGKNLLEDTAVCCQLGLSIPLYCKVTLGSYTFILPLSQSNNKNSLTCWLMRDNVLQNTSLFKVW